MIFDTDAFTSGQIISKIWLLQHLEMVISEKRLRHKPLTTTILAGWYGVTALLAYVRGNIDLDVTCIDIDPEAIAGALCLNETLVHHGRFRADTADILKYQYLVSPDIVINTASEHMTGEWFDHIPHGVLVVIQANDMPHNDHAWCCQSSKEIEERFVFSEIYRSVSREFRYNDWSFNRHMVIGKK